MDIKWSYALIGIIYVIVIILRVINKQIEKEFLDAHKDTVKVFVIKRDFFTSVWVVCLLVTIGINIAALIGGKPLNLSSMIITLLVTGFTILNSFCQIFFSESGQEVLLVGYSLKEKEIDKIKVKEGKKATLFNMNFKKEIDSYNYAKIMAFGPHRETLKKVLVGLSD